jgi:threonine synthase
MYKIVDFRTKKRVHPKNLVFAGSQGPWEILMDLDAIRSQLDIEYFKKEPPSLAKYLPFLPIQSCKNFVSLQETATPLIRSKNLSKKLGISLYFKLESKNPTSAFKDRGSAVELTVAKELGAKAIALASTGNMAASCSCYAAQAQLPCFVFVPEGAPLGKLAQIIAYGGHIVQVKGSYSNAVRLAEEASIAKGFYLAGDYAFRLEGSKTAAFELMDQLNFDLPDRIVVPMGGGTNIASYAKGLKEYRELGLIDGMPKLVGVQAEGAAPIVNSFKGKSKSIVPVESVHTLASAIAIGNPLDGIKALDAIYSTKGNAIAVSDTDILKAQYILAKEEGLFVECSAAATLAAVIKMKDQLQKEKIVCILTGDGLKDPSPFIKITIKPPTIQPKVSEFISLYDEGFFKNQAVVFLDKQKKLFSKSPSILAIKHTVKQLFQSEYDAEQLRKITWLARAYLKKGKPITVADFEDIIQDALSMVRHEKLALRVIDFSVETGKDRKPRARVKVQFKGRVASASAIGVGPFDAIIKALIAACRRKIDFTLSDYEVETRSQGADAVVYVELMLQLQRGEQLSVGRATSPDIIQASVEAFEEAYNGLKI